MYLFDDYAKYLSDYGILFAYQDNKIYSLTNVFDYFAKNLSSIPVSDAYDILSYMESQDISIIGEDLTFDNGQFLRYTPFGNIYYELFVIKEDQGIDIKFFEAGTYTEPHPIYYLQPIN